MPKRLSLLLDAAQHLDFDLPTEPDPLTPGQYRLKDKIVRWADESGVEVTLHPSRHRASFISDHDAEAFRSIWGGQPVRR
ncbi:MAG: hypothetical protein Alpg2KO_30240 [Alphaproteobacteria bacterium]